MKLYLYIALVSLKGCIRRMFLCIKMAIILSEMHMMNLHIVDTNCLLVSLTNICWFILLKNDAMNSQML